MTLGPDASSTDQTTDPRLPEPTAAAPMGIDDIVLRGGVPRGQIVELDGLRRGGRIEIHTREAGRTDVEATVAPTGIDALDTALGGGLQCGKVTFIEGSSGSETTAVAGTIVATTQERNGHCVLIDADDGLPLPYAERLGIDWTTLTTIDPRAIFPIDLSPHDRVEALAEVVRSSEPDVLVLNSMAPLYDIPISLLEGLFTEIERAGTACVLTLDLRHLVNTSPPGKLANKRLQWIKLVKRRAGAHIIELFKLAPDDHVIRMQARVSRPSRQWDRTEAILEITNGASTGDSAAVTSP